ncbi:MAG: glycosyltransferase family 4 protein [bacterium]|nr:glycosyltransferase family 4 protein [bacterium]
MRILFVAMANSIHTARWISQLSETGWNLHLFPVDGDAIHPFIKHLTVHKFTRKTLSEVDPSIHISGIWPFSRGAGVIKRIIKHFWPAWEEQVWLLTRTIRTFQPDIIHSLEMQHAAYLTQLVKQQYLKQFPTWIYSCWGSDIYYFQQFEDHRERLTRVLRSCDFLFTDAKRDVQLAKRYGFRGEVLGTFPGAGGFMIDQMRSSVVEMTRPSSRKVIVVKSYHGWVHRPHIILKALERCRDELQGYTIIMYLANDQEIIKKMKQLSHRLGVEFEIFRHTTIHAEVLRLFVRARLSLASNISDGVPNSMLESMTMGAFPIQSDTGSTAEWIQHGVNGMLAAPEDVDGFALAIKTALTNDAMVDHAADMNLHVLKTRIDYSIVQPQVLEAYRKALRHERTTYAD